MLCLLTTADIISRSKQDSLSFALHLVLMQSLDSYFLYPLRVPMSPAKAQTMCWTDSSGLVMLFSGMRHHFCNNCISERKFICLHYTETAPRQLICKERISPDLHCYPNTPQIPQIEEANTQKEPLLPQESILHQSSKFTLISGGSLNPSSWQT